MADRANGPIRRPCPHIRGALWRMSKCNSLVDLSADDMKGLLPDSCQLSPAPPDCQTDFRMKSSVPSRGQYFGNENSAMGEIIFPGFVPFKLALFRRLGATLPSAIPFRWTSPRCILFHGLAVGCGWVILDRVA